MAWRKQTTITCTLCGLTAEFKFEGEFDAADYSATCRLAAGFPDFGCPLLQEAIEKATGEPSAATIAWIANFRRD